MLKHISKFIPWKTDREKRQEFLDKLKGERTFQIRENPPTGAVFMLSNKDTGSIQSYVYLGSDRWVGVGGTGVGDGLLEAFTRRQLELHLTRLVREANNENSIHIINEGNYLTWIKPHENK